MADHARARRRREAREGLIHGVTNTGSYFTPEAMLPDRMPVKVPGRHRWIATAAYTLSDTEAAAADEGVRTELSVEKLCMFGIGCVDCEGEYKHVRTAPCPAGDEWYLPDHPKHVKGADRGFHTD